MRRIAEAGFEPATGSGQTNRVYGMAKVLHMPAVGQGQNPVNGAGADALARVIAGRLGQPITDDSFGGIVVRYDANLSE